MPDSVEPPTAGTEFSAAILRQAEAMQEIAGFMENRGETDEASHLRASITENQSLVAGAAAVAESAAAKNREPAPWWKRLLGR